jgi:hypothetical protein
MSRVIFNGGAAQHLLNHLGVDVLGSQQGHAVCLRSWRRAE